MPTALSESRSTSVLRDPELELLLHRLHAMNDAQAEEMARYEAERSRNAGAAVSGTVFYSDMMVALDRDKAEFCCQLCRGASARRVAEIGTSFGVSTLYLAAAVRDVVRADGGEGLVIATEHEPAKAARARANFAQAGLSGFIELREGDLRETLKRIDTTIDFVLMDIWTPMARPALELLYPHLRRGSMVVADNTISCQAGYADYFQFINDPARGFRTMTLPFAGGLELSVRC